VQDLIAVSSDDSGQAASLKALFVTAAQNNIDVMALVL
jgi:hypothetical protein